MNTAATSTAAAQVAPITTAYDVLSAAWPQDVVDVSIEAHFMVVTFRASTNAIGRELRWDHYWPTIDANGLQTGTSLRTPAAGVRLVQDATGYYIETFGTAGTIREPYLPGNSFTIGIGPFIDNRPSALHPGLWNSQIVEYDLASGGSHEHARDGFLLVGHVGQRMPGLDSAGQPLSGAGQHVVVGESLARPLVVEVLRDDGQSGLARVDSQSWTGTAKAGVPVTFSIVAQPAGATGASVSPVAPTTDSEGHAAVAFVAGSVPGQYVVRATVRNACLGASVDFPVEVREVHALRLDIEATPPVRVAPGGDPILLGISAPRAPSRQRLTAVGVHAGPDGVLGTADDEDLGPVPADWSYAGGAKNPPTLVGGGANGILRQSQVTLEAGDKTGTAKLVVAFTPRTSTRTSISGAFMVQVVAIAFAVVDPEGTDFDGDPKVQDASGVDLASLKLELNGIAIDRARWEDRVTPHKPSKNGPAIGLEVRFGPSFAELRKGSNVLQVEGRDLAGNPLPDAGRELTYDFPNGGLSVLPLRAAGH